ncbi:MAG: hypothetical protein ACOC0N_05350, partial [Chroococcales cyanobacterium]
MAEHLIQTKVFPKELTFKPGGDPVSFNVTVLNNSDRFASFQLDVVAAGADPKHRAHWFTITPEVSSKKPPGDVTEFQVILNDIPVPGFVGLMNLEVRVSSIELADTDRLVLRLQVEEGTTVNPVKLDLPLQRFLGSPGNLVEIPVRVYNPNQRPSSITLTCLGLNPTWFPDGTERRFYLRPGEQVETSFLCQIPPGFEALSKIYSLVVEAKDSTGIPVQVEVTLEVLPIGEVYFRGYPKRHLIPAKWGWLPSWKAKPATYTLEFENNSNIYQQANVDLEEDGRADCEVEILPDTVDLLPGETTALEVIAEAKRPWLGLTKKINLVFHSALSDERLGNPDPEQETLELHVRPIIPLWLQVGSGLLALGLLLYSIMSPPKHRAPVQSVSFNGVADWVISGSDDHTVRRWRVEGARLKASQILADTNKAVRVVRYRPVNNNVVAVGLENGQIQLWDLLSGESQNLVYQKDDRVFDLAFTQDSHYLFSGHGNDVVLQWDLKGRNEQPLPKPIAQQELSFTVSDLALVGEKEHSLLIGGRFNQLALWKTV